ncbi:MAG: class I mannose-6-phosphate isomerase [Pleurocapsa minor GSE-CHR-MK-17-07R]|nr:class I mannose-6-phosphate isomerase [Pleurocapsa minor GSE-CHR-MK 17-07R]
MSEQASLYPMLLQPVLHTRVWGGRRLETFSGHALPDARPYGESWEMHDSAVVENGVYRGQTVRQVLDVLGTDLCGRSFNPADGMPLLAKILDCEDWLSVQVHPDDALAAELEGEPRGKTEAWIVLEARPDARLVWGLKPGTTPEGIRATLDDGTFESLLSFADVKQGDVLFVEAGTVHALGPGLLIYEIQQSSDTTYRLYDWNRLGLDGQPRALHVDKSIAVSRLDAAPKIIHPNSEDGLTVVPLLRSPFFNTTLIRARPSDTTLLMDTAGMFYILTCIAGSFAVKAANGDESLMLAQGRTALLPAAMGAYTLTAASDASRVLMSWTDQ